MHDCVHFPLAKTAAGLAGVMGLPLSLQALQDRVETVALPVEAKGLKSGMAFRGESTILW